MIRKLLVAPVLIVTVQLAWASETARIAGRVLDPAGDVVAAKVVLIRLEDLTVREAYSGEGQFDFSELPPGRYELKVGGIHCFRTITRELSLKPGNTERIEVRLKIDTKKCKPVSTG